MGASWWTVEERVLGRRRGWKDDIGVWERVRRDKTERNAQTWLRHVGVMCKLMVPRTNVGQLRSTRERMPGRGMCKNICRTRFGEGGVQRNDGEKKTEKRRERERKSCETVEGI